MTMIVDRVTMTLTVGHPVALPSHWRTWSDDKLLRALTMTMTNSGEAYGAQRALQWLAQGDGEVPGVLVRRADHYAHEAMTICAAWDARVSDLAAEVSARGLVDAPPHEDRATRLGVDPTLIYGPDETYIPTNSGDAQ